MNNLFMDFKNHMRTNSNASSHTTNKQKKKKIHTVLHNKKIIIVYEGKKNY